MKDNEKRVHEAGIPILGDADTAILSPDPNMLDPFGSSPHQELDYTINNAGLTTLEVLRALFTARLQRLGSAQAWIGGIAYYPTTN